MSAAALTLLAGFAWGAPVQASTAPLDDTIMVSTESLAQPATEAFLLTLPQAVAGAVELRVAYLQSLQGERNAKGELMTAKGNYDPTLTGNFTNQFLRTRTVTKPGVFPNPTDTREVDYSAGLAQNLPTGGQLSFNTGDIGKQSQPFPTLHTGSAVLSLSHPLLRGAGIAAAYAGVRAAFARLQSADATARRALEQAIADTENAYWALLQAQAQAEAARLSMDAGDLLLSRNRELERRQLIAPFDVLTAAAGAAQRRTTYLQAERARRDAADALIFTAFGADAARRFRAQEYDIRASTEAMPAAKLTDAAAAEEQALETRQDLRAERALVEAAEIQAVAARRFVLPDLSATGSLGGGGSYQDGANSARFDSVGRALTLADKQWSMGLNLSLPIFLRADRGRYLSALAALDNERLQQVAVENGVRQDVRAADRAVRFGRTRLSEADQAVLLSQLQLDGERKRLQLGLSDTYRVLQVERDTTQARLDRANALADLARAATAYRLAIGTIERDYGVTVSF